MQLNVKNVISTPSHRIHRHTYGRTCSDVVRRLYFARVKKSVVQFARVKKSVVQFARVKKSVVQFARVLLDLNNTYHTRVYLAYILSLSCVYPEFILRISLYTNVGPSPRVSPTRTDSRSVCTTVGYEPVVIPTESN
jgi:hypothetical protein